MQELFSKKREEEERGREKERQKMVVERQRNINGIDLRVLPVFVISNTSGGNMIRSLSSYIFSRLSSFPSVKLHFFIRSPLFSLASPLYSTCGCHGSWDAFERPFVTRISYTQSPSRVDLIPRLQTTYLVYAGCMRLSVAFLLFRITAGRCRFHFPCNPVRPP